MVLLLQSKEVVNFEGLSLIVDDLLSITFDGGNLRTSLMCNFLSSIEIMRNGQLKALWHIDLKKKIQRSLPDLSKLATMSNISRPHVVLRGSTYVAQYGGGAIKSRMIQHL